MLQIKICLESGLLQEPEEDLPEDGSYRLLVANGPAGAGEGS